MGHVLALQLLELFDVLSVELAKGFISERLLVIHHRVRLGQLSLRSLELSVQRFNNLLILHLDALGMRVILLKTPVQVKFLLLDLLGEPLVLH